MGNGITLVFFLLRSVVFRVALFQRSQARCWSLFITASLSRIVLLHRAQLVHTEEQMRESLFWSIQQVPLVMLLSVRILYLQCFGV